MKTFWLILLGFLTCGAAAFGQENIQMVHEVAQSSSTRTQTINVCNAVIDVAATTSSGTLTSRFALEIYNLAASTSTINCAPDVSVSSNPTSVWYGREIPAGVGMYFGLSSNRSLYCLSQNSSGCTRATITQIK